jgi:predicted GNAT superfamily acetyltransferase
MASVAEANGGPTILIRDIDSSELRAVEALQKEVWGVADLDVVPVTLFVAAKAVGATLIGAYDAGSLVGFVYGFTGYEEGHVTHHSHMLAVRPAYRNYQLGFKLKLAQRERVLAQGIKSITWTFDPLQSLNAHLNFAKLGVVSDTYKINFYGEATSSFLHQIGTDRLWVTWPLDSQRVRDRLQTRTTKQPLAVANAPLLVRVTANCVPQMIAEADTFANDHLTIEIPGDINALQRQHPQLAVEWREATRWAFTRALDAGYVVEEFYTATRNDQRVGVYLLSLPSQNRLR